MFRYFWQFPLLVIIPVFLAIGSSVLESAIAIPTNNPKGCINDRDIKQVPLEFYIIYDPENPDSNSPASIRIRENPSTESAIVHVASSGNPVIIYQQVVIDKYCWLKVDVTSVSKNDPTSYITVKGWVRGDFVTEDKSP